MSAALIVVGILLLAAGVAVLVLDVRRRGVRTRARREWADHHAARYAEVDPVLTGQWRHGVFSRGGAGRAVELVNAERGGDGLYLFDLEQAGTVVATVLALRRPTTSATTLELRRGSVRAAPDGAVASEAGMDLLGPVGERYAFTDDLESARCAVDQRLALLANEIGDDVSVLWTEDNWALAALDVTAGPQRWADVTAILVRFADLMRLLPPIPT